jgi:hypothetical protein
MKKKLFVPNNFSSGKYKNVKGKRIMSLSGCLLLLMLSHHCVQTNANFWLQNEFQRWQRTVAT